MTERDQLRIFLPHAQNEGAPDGLRTVLYSEVRERASRKAPLGKTNQNSWMGREVNPCARSMYRSLSSGIE